MATTASFLAPTSFSAAKGWTAGSKGRSRRRPFSIKAQQQQQQEQVLEQEPEQASIPQQQQQQQPPPQAQPRITEQQPTQPFAKSKNMSREMGGQWLSSVTRHVRIYAAYIDPVTHAFDQTQTDKLTLILDPQNEFAWTPESISRRWHCPTVRELISMVYMHLHALDSLTKRKNHAGASNAGSDRQI